MFPPPPAIKSTLIAVSLALSTLSLNAHATLINYTSNGADLVYSTFNDVTSTRSECILCTLSSELGYTNFVNAIIAASSAITYGSTPYILTASDFPIFGSEAGKTTWWGANALTAYLNSINYGGSNSWYLPRVANEISSTQGPVGAAYWTSLEYEHVPTLFVGVALYTYVASPMEYLTGKHNYAFAWVFTEGNLSTVSSVHEPEFGAMYLLGIGMVAGVVRRRQKTA